MGIKKRITILKGYLFAYSSDKFRLISTVEEKEPSCYFYLYDYIVFIKIIYIWL